MMAKATTRRRRVVRSGATQVETQHHEPLLDDSKPSNLISRHVSPSQGSVQHEKPSSSSAFLAFLLDSEEDRMIRVRIFPRYAIVFLAALTFYSRYLLVTGSEGLGMIHPDENFQAVEVAYAEVYGYGILPFRGQEVAKTRTWAYSDLYVLLFQAKEFLGWETNPFVLARNFHCAIAALLPVIIYKFVRTVFGQCRDIAFSSAVLVAFSKHLMIFGTHPCLSSFISPMIFLISTIILRLARIEPGTSQTRFGSIQAFGLFICGTLVGYLAHFNNSLLLTVLLIISGFIRTPSDVHCSHDPVTPLLPSYRWLINTLALMCGTVVGLILTVTGTVVHGNNWFEIPFQTIKNLVVTQSTDKSEGTPFNFLGSFIGGSQIHLIILGAAVAVALIYLSYCLRVTDTFDVWIKGGDEDDNDAVLFSSSTKITIISTCLLLFHYIQNDSTLYQMHDVLVLTLVSGASGAYILYRGLYVYILKIVEPGKTTRNIVKLILYAELLLYMFESRMTFPTAMNKGIETWAHQGLWESSYVNLCLKYVNEQPDVTGVVIDYPVLMTGGFSLLGHQVPVWARHGHEFREWRMPDRFDLDGEPRKKFIMLNEVNDVVSLLNTPLLLKKVIEAPEYNYVVVTGKRKFPKRGFRKVFNASDVCVFKRSKSQSEKQYLLKLASEIPLGSNSTVLAYEGIRLLNFKLWEEAFRRLVVTTELQPSLTDAWRLLIVTLKQIDTTSVDKRKYDISTYTSRCLELHSSDCIVSDPSWLPKIDLTYDLDQISTTYKF